MKRLFIIMTVLSLLGCHNVRVVDKGNGGTVDTLFILDTLCPDVIIVHDTIYAEGETITDTFIPDIINPWPGFIIDVDHWHGDSLLRVWMQWGEGGEWHQYILNDTVR